MAEGVIAEGQKCADAVQLDMNGVVQQPDRPTQRHRVAGGRMQQGQGVVERDRILQAPQRGAAHPGPKHDCRAASPPAAHQVDIPAGNAKRNVSHSSTGMKLRNKGRMGSKHPGACRGRQSTTQDTVLSGNSCGWHARRTITATCDWDTSIQRGCKCR